MITNLTMINRTISNPNNTPRIMIFRFQEENHDVLNLLKIVFLPIGKFSNIRSYNDQLLSQ
ncbi:MAG: hypothetical protein A2Z14_16295 [Chloroflexi bacterium RBG_16_48_8]|nr:MAG: hypothetical protein A2Z14_16295 [Chloroflexi bacterium RBG_16_48_8]